MKANYKKPEVLLIKNIDCVRKAWEVSHPYDDVSGTKLDDLVNMDLPVVGFRYYTFQMRTSILFRDLLFTIRPIVAWARSNRSLKFSPENIFLSGEYEHIADEYLQKCMSEVFEGTKNGVPTDLIKSKLPMATSTEFLVAIDDRSLVTFLKTLKNHNKELFNVYGKLILTAIGQNVAYIDNRKCLDIFDKLAIQESEYKHLGQSGKMAEMFIGVYKVANNLMAQFIRQHYSTVKNELYNKMNQKSLLDLSFERCDDLTVVAVYANINSYKKLLSVRSCFIAQWDKESNQSWSSITGSYVGRLSANEFAGLLPCRCNRTNCTIRGSVEDRVYGRDVNVPCPILLEYPDLVNYRGMKYQSDSKVYEAWTKIVPFIKDNPQNEWRKLYTENVLVKDNQITILDDLKKKIKDDEGAIISPNKLTNEKVLKEKEVAISISDPGNGLPMTGSIEKLGLSTAENTKTDKPRVTQQPVQSKLNQSSKKLMKKSAQTKAKLEKSESDYNWTEL